MAGHSNHCPIDRVHVSISLPDSARLKLEDLRYYLHLHPDECMNEVKGLSGVVEHCILSLWAQVHLKTGKVDPLCYQEQPGPIASKKSKKRSKSI